MRAKSVFVNDRLVGEAETWASVYKLLAKKGLALLGTPRTTEGPFAFYLHGEVANVVQSESVTDFEI